MKTRLMKKLAEQAVASKITNEVIDFILDNMAFEADSDEDFGISVQGTIATSSVTAKFGLGEQDLTELKQVLEADDYVKESIEDVAKDAKHDSIESFTMPELHVTVDNNKIVVSADIEDFKSKEDGHEEVNNDNDPSNYHGPKDFI